MADVLNDATAALYRRLVPSVVIVRLRLPLREARRRATLRPRHLTDKEFEGLHAMVKHKPELHTPNGSRNGSHSPPLHRARMLAEHEKEGLD